MGVGLWSVLSDGMGCWFVVHLSGGMVGWVGWGVCDPLCFWWSGWMWLGCGFVSPVSVGWVGSYPSCIWWSGYGIVSFLYMVE